MKTLLTDNHLIRVASVYDAEQMYEAESAAWSTIHAADLRVIQCRLNHYASTTLVAINRTTKRLDGFFATVPVRDDDSEKTMPWLHYAQIATTNQQDLQVEVSHLHAISLTVRPDAPRGTATNLLASCVRHAASLGYRQLVTVTRAPKYFLKHRNGVSFDDYCLGLREGRFREPLFHICEATGGIFQGYIEGYFSDPESLDYGIKFVHYPLQLELTGDTERDIARISRSGAVQIGISDVVKSDVAEALLIPLCHRCSASRSVERCRLSTSARYWKRTAQR